MNRKTRSSFQLIALIFIAFVLIFSGSVKAEPPPDFKGKVITMVVPFPPAAGTDILARVIVNHLRKHIPGKPNIVIRNMAGAQGLIGAHYVYFTNRVDGSVLLITSGSNTNMNILRLKAVEHYFEKMHPVYSPPAGNVVVCKPGLIKEPKDIIKVKGLIFGHSSATGSTGSVYVWAKELIGFEAKEVWGYDGGGPSRMAFLAGEINATGATTVGYNTTLKPFVNKGEAAVMFQTGILDDKGDVVREEGAGDVPTVTELYEQIYGKKPFGPALEAYKLVVGAGTYARTVLLPTKTRPEIVKLYRDAFEAMVKNPEFLKESELLNPGSPHYVGEKLARGYPAGVSGPPEVIQFMRKVLSEKYSVNFD